MHNRHNIATETRRLETATTQTKPASAGWGKKPGGWKPRLYRQNLPPQVGEMMVLSGYITETRRLETATTQTKPADAGWEIDGFIGVPVVGNSQKLTITVG